MFLNKLHPRTQCSFSKTPSGGAGGEGLKYWAGLATRNGFVRKSVKVTWCAGRNLISDTVEQLQCLTFIVEFGLSCNQQKKILFCMQLPHASK